MNRNLRLAERIRNAAATQEAENVHARHAYLHACGDGSAEIATIWYKSPKTIWSHGFFATAVGWNEIWYNHAVYNDANPICDFPAYMLQYPEIAGKDPRPLMCIAMHVLANEIIEVADDGNTARAMFLTPGILISHINSNGLKFAEWQWERYGADFICDNGKWCFYHELVCPDHVPSFDSENYAASSYKELTAREETERIGESAGGFAPKNEEIPRIPGKFTIQGCIHKKFSPIQPVQNTVPWPEPYSTLDDANSYAPGYN